jgi:hypothetical protein
VIESAALRAVLMRRPAPASFPRLPPRLNAQNNKMMIRMTMTTANRL